MRVLVVDDEPLARQRLERLLLGIDRATVVIQASDGCEAIDRVNQYQPDIVLMDVCMPVMGGLEAAEVLAALASPPAIILCTAYHDYALKAFAVNAIDYLVKPVRQEQLEHALNKAGRVNQLQRQILMQQPGNDSQQARQCIGVSTMAGFILVPVMDIRYFYAKHKYVTMAYCRNGKSEEALLDEPLKALEVEFGQSFIRVHRNALAAEQHIKGVDKHRYYWALQMTNVDIGPRVSRRHLPKLRQFLKQQ